LGLGGSIAKAKHVTETMIYAASKALADCTTPSQLESGLLYPPLSSIRSISAQIALAIIKTAISYLFSN